MTNSLDPMLDEDLLFAPEETEPQQQIDRAWKVLVVDDEQEIHNITRVVLDDYSFEGKGLNLISAYSAMEACFLISEHPDTAVVLLDVVMEEDNAGLKVVKYIREVLKNSMVRIILRTGQPGQAPEERIIVDYDINDYKEKTELTYRKLFTTITTALRSYRDLTTIDNSRRGLEKIVESSVNIFELQSIKRFSQGVLEQLTDLLLLNRNAIATEASSLFATHSGNEFMVLAATGKFSGDVDASIEDALPEHVHHRLNRALQRKANLFLEDYMVVYFSGKNGSENMLYVEGIAQLSELDHYLIEAFCTNVSIALDNISLNEEIENTQKEIIFTLGEIAEARSHETGKHVKRVAEYSRVLAAAWGLPEEEVNLIKLASPMHDVGKLGVPDAVLNKPGRLTPEEFDVIKTHSVMGYEMLKNSSRTIMSTAAVIAYQHHEKYNGTGYPMGLKGEDIHLYGRITAIADVFDALGSRRVYKPAWELDRILEFFKNEQGEQFDPKLVDLLFANLAEILSIRDTFRD